jgi:hypothetical protein
MKKLYFLLLSFLMISFSFGQDALPIAEDFGYADGSLVGNGNWANHSGTAGDLLVASGAVVVQHGTPSEDANLPFVPVIGGDLYYGIDFSVTASGAITTGDEEYFAHFKDSGFGFRGRLDVVEGGGGGDYTVGISSSTSTAQAIWGTDLTFGVTYRAIVRYNQDTGTAQLWIDAASSGDTSISGTADGATAIESFALRQSDSNENETVTVDNLRLATTFSGATLSTNDFNTKKFSVYPNPTVNGVVNIVSSNSSVGNLNIAVYDVLGKLVINTKMNSSILDVSHLTPGVYVMNITQGNARATKKLVVK